MEQKQTVLLPFDEAGQMMLNEPLFKSNCSPKMVNIVIVKGAQNKV